LTARPVAFRVALAFAVIDAHDPHCKCMLRMAVIDHFNDSVATTRDRSLPRLGSLTIVHVRIRIFAEIGDPLEATMSAEEPPQGANSDPAGGSAAAKPQAWGDHTSAIGIVGLGLMGTACAHRLRQAGTTVIAFDIDAAKRAAAQTAGASEAFSVAELVQRCRAIILAVFNTDQVEAVVEGHRGMLDAAPVAGGAPIVICLSTCDPDRLAALGKRMATRGFRLVEAPISGSSRQFANGEGVGLIGGDPATIAEISDVLDVLCPRRHLLGAIGNGSRAKLAVNLVLGLNRAALAEGIVFAERLGLPRTDFLKVARESAAYSQVMDVKGDLMATRSFEQPQSKVDQSLKDFRLMIDQATRQGQALPFAQVYASLLADCVERGEGALDNAIIVEAIARSRSVVTEERGQAASR
jgi:L-threonate 2-dehydrogenase